MTITLASFLPKAAKPHAGVLNKNGSFFSRESVRSEAVSGTTVL
jgi:hypothetical protein